VGSSGTNSKDVIVDEDENSSVSHIISLSAWLRLSEDLRSKIIHYFDTITELREVDDALAVHAEWQQLWRSNILFSSKCSTSPLFTRIEYNNDQDLAWAASMGLLQTQKSIHIKKDLLTYRNSEYKDKTHSTIGYILSRIRHYNKPVDSYWNRSENEHINVDMKPVLDAILSRDSAAEVSSMVNTTDDNNMTPLEWAFRISEEYALLLLEKGNADATINGCNGVSPLHIACEKGYINVAKVLIKKGVNLNLTCDYGYTPMKLATRYGHGELVDILSKAILN